MPVNENCLSETKDAIINKNKTTFDHIIPIKVKCKVLFGLNIFT